MLGSLSKHVHCLLLASEKAHCPSPNYRHPHAHEQVLYCPYSCWVWLEYLYIILIIFIFKPKSQGAGNSVQTPWRAKTSETIHCSCLQSFNRPTPSAKIKDTCWWEQRTFPTSYSKGFKELLTKEYVFWNKLWTCYPWVQQWELTEHVLANSWSSDCSLYSIMSRNNGLSCMDV